MTITGLGNGLHTSPCLAAAGNTAMIGKTRKDLARVKTVLREGERSGESGEKGLR